MPRGTAREPAEVHPTAPPQVQTASVIVAAGPRVWSTAFFTAVARFVVVGVGTGALVGVVLGVLPTVLGAGSVEWLGVLVGCAAAVGAALGLPTAVVGAGTGLVVAARRPGARGLALVGLLWCPLALVGWSAWTWLSLGPSGWPWRLVGLLAAEAVVVVCVVMTRRWVTAPLSSGWGSAQDHGRGGPIG